MAKRGGRRTRELVKKYGLLGLGPAEIGRLTGITREAARQHLQNLRDDGELPPAEEKVS